MDRKSIDSKAFEYQHYFKSRSSYDKYTNKWNTQNLPSTHLQPMYQGSITITQIIGGVSRHTTCIPHHEQKRQLTQRKHTQEALTQVNWVVEDERNEPVQLFSPDAMLCLSRRERTRKWKWKGERTQPICADFIFIKKDVKKKKASRSMQILYNVRVHALFRRC